MAYGNTLHGSHTFGNISEVLLLAAHPYHGNRSCIYKDGKHVKKN